MGPRKVYIGTSGWIYEDWTGPFYPPDVKGADRLVYYASRFNTVEVNATFYRLPTSNMIRAWNEKLKRGFHLVLKGSRVITHMKKLIDCDEALERFFERALQLQRLKVILWQLPPHLKKDVGRLDRFLASLPRTVRHAVEFRHTSWWDPEVDATLKKHRAAFVAVSHPDLPEDIRPTTDFLYIRFHGQGSELYSYDYSKKELAQWAARIQEFRGRRRVYAFFNNDYHAYAPQNALTLRQQLSASA